MTLWNRFRGACETIPFWLVALAARIGLARVFGQSAVSHLANWQTTQYLFENTFNVPLLPPDIAAYMTVAIEVGSTPLLLLGLFTRPTALVLAGMTLVIEVFVFPQAWPTHIQWAVMQLVLLRGGAGVISLDALIARYVASKPGVAA